MSTVPCPCCGSPMAVPASLVALVHVPLPPIERTILNLFAAAYPRRVSTRAVINALWGLDPNGGPVSAENNISVRLVHINRVLVPLGWRIWAPTGNGRMLTQVPPAVSMAKAA